ncbi:MAG: YkgJ family cysteine cluster protein [Candidatus Magnetomorum sp.]|nr:YkgJ family cysteine cluster protein [Candidatus Magnetomorum sp.]
MVLFHCQQCGDCCKGYGGTYVTDADIQKISHYKHVPLEQFIEKYCVKSGTKYVLAQAENGYCIFFDNKLCTIHPVKPRMCRSWPYIESVLVDPGNWAIMGSCCPGINTHAPLERVTQTIKQEMAKNQ